MDSFINVELLKHPWNWLVVGFILVTTTSLMHLIWRDPQGN